VSLTASFRGSKVRKKIILEKSNIYKNSQNAIKIKKTANYLKKMLSLENRLKYALFTANKVILRFFFEQDQNFLKIHNTDGQNFWRNQKNACLTILNDKPNCQVSMILMNHAKRYFFREYKNE
jgi:hypothetical protein